MDMIRYRAIKALADFEYQDWRTKMLADFQGELPWHSEMMMTPEAEEQVQPPIDPALLRPSMF